MRLVRAQEVAETGSIAYEHGASTPCDAKQSIGNMEVDVKGIVVGFRSIPRAQGDHGGLVGTASVLQQGMYR